MVKIFCIAAAIFTISSALDDFESLCLSCHEKQGIPTEALYKRYLLKHSSDRRIEAAMVEYLEKPVITKSIMPPRFINKFGIKESSQLSEVELKKYVRILIERYNIRDRLSLDKQ